MVIVMPSNIKHIIIEVVTQNDKILFDVTEAVKISEIFAKVIKSKILANTYQKFDNGAYTYLAVLSTSHIVINTYPEKKYLDIDIAWCSNVDLDNNLLVDLIKKNLAPVDYEVIYIDRKLARRI